MINQIAGAIVGGVAGVVVGFFISVMAVQEYPSVPTGQTILGMVIMTGYVGGLLGAWAHSRQ